MTDDKQVEASDAPENEAAPEEKTDTQPESSEAAVKEDAGKEEPEDASSWKNEKKSMAGRISKMQKEINQSKQAVSMYDALNKAAQENTDFGKAANAELVKQGVLDKEAFDKQYGSEGKKEETQTPEKSTDITGEELTYLRNKRAQEFFDQSKFFEEFEKDKEDIASGSEMEAGENRRDISALAKRNMREGMPQQDAYNNAYLRVLHPEKLKEAGEVEGIVKAQSVSPSIGGASGQQSKQTGEVSLTDAERDAAKKLKISEEDYVKFRDDNPEVI